MKAKELAKLLSRPGVEIRVNVSAFGAVTAAKLEDAGLPVVRRYGPAERTRQP